jgi:DNA topoisomerase-1
MSANLTVDSSSDEEMSLADLAKQSTTKSTSSETKKKKKKKKKDKKVKKKKKKDKKDKKRKSSSSSSSSAKPAKRARTKKASGPKKPKAKTLTQTQQLDRAMKAYRWWEADALPPGVKWQTLEHHGVHFPPAYTPHGVSILYEGNPVVLTPVQEEMASFYAGMALDGPQLSDPKIAKVFNKNFFHDFKKILGKNHVVKKFNLINFDELRAYVNREREARRGRSKEEKAEEKVDKDVLSSQYAYANVDGNIQKVGNFTIEPPGLFRGRGEHPKTGTLKTNVAPEQVTINTGYNEAVPRCKEPGHAWGTVISDNTVTWLALWHENVMNGTKYVWLSASSGFKGRGDRDKYEKARKLKLYIDKIRANYRKNMKKGKKIVTRQTATAMWIIDVLALRAGNEKDDDLADTVGCCSLRVEHLKFGVDKSGNQTPEGSHVLTLDFLGKDSMRHHQEIDFDRYAEVGTLVYENLHGFCTKKKPSDDVFDQLSVSDLNDHLKSLMPGLSAKVFRTFNASSTLENELPKNVSHLSLKEKVVLYNEANRKVAILCNHQKTLSSKFQESFAKLENKRDLYKKQINDLKKMLSQLKKGKGDDIKMYPSVAPKEKEKRDKISHLFKRMPNVEQLKKRKTVFVGRLNNLELDMKNKDDNKTVALGTSKINYMDPRISVAWCKREECDISKVFAKALRDKFPWAMSAKMTYSF